MMMEDIDVQYGDTGIVGSTENVAFHDAAYVIYDRIFNSLLIINWLIARRRKQR
jgi:hypothetical protein